MSRLREAERRTACPACGAPAGARCVGPQQDSAERTPHAARLAADRAAHPRGGKQTPGPGKRLGRPPAAGVTRRTYRGPVALTEQEAAQLDARAAERGLKVQQAIRGALRDARLID